MAKINLANIVNTAIGIMLMNAPAIAIFSMAENISVNQNKMLYAPLIFASMIYPLCRGISIIYDLPEK